MRTFNTILQVSALMLVSLSAYAYIGPGAGLTAIGAAIALVGAILLGIVGFFWYPLKRALRGNTEEPDSMEDGEEKPEPAEQPVARSAEKPEA